MSEDYDVAIVGAGAAGIGAAMTLAGTGRSVVLVEAGDRIGGRAHSALLGGMPLDLGCGYLHSADRNRWTAIAERSGFTVDRSSPAWRAQYRDLGFPPDERAAASAAFEAFVERLEADPPRSDRASDALEPDGRWNPYIEALSGYINGAEFDQVSVADYLAYDRAATEANWRVREGYGALIAASLPAGVALRTGAAVTAIDHRGARLRLETGAGTIAAARAIVTVSTTILATGALRFVPALPDKVAAAAALPLGLADKLFLALDDSGAVGADSHLLGNPRAAETGSYQLRPLGRPVIEGFFGGKAARHLEAAGPGAMAAFALDELAALLGNDIRRVLRPIGASAWGCERWIGGSYSHALPGRAGSRAILAEPVDDRIFFAGEACSPSDFSTAHGALATGIAAARAAMAGGGE